jgi:hypothetical protein
VYKTFTTKESFIGEVSKYLTDKGKDPAKFVEEFEKNLKIVHSKSTNSAALFTMNAVVDKVNPVNGDYHKVDDPAFTTHYVCHGAFTRMFKKEVTVYVCDFFTNNNAFEGYSVWFDYIFGKKSPWRDLFDKDMLVYEQDGRKICMFFKGLDSITNTKLKLLTNFLIANRLKSAWNLAWVFQTLVEEYKLPEHLSLWFCTLFSSNSRSIKEGDHYSAKLPKNSRYLSLSRRYSGDQPFNQLASYKLLKDCSPDFAKVKDTDFSPNPCNYIWDSSDGKHHKFQKFLFDDAGNKSYNTLKVFMDDFNCGNYKVDVNKIIKELDLD